MNKIQNTPGTKSFALPSLYTIIHVFWLRKWIIFFTWLIIAIPLGISLSFVNLPKSYSAKTLLRFPAVRGAQTTMMRDVAITQRESVISLIKSYQVLMGTINKLFLRLRINTPEQFRHNTIDKVNYSKHIEPGRYTIKKKNKNEAALIMELPNMEKQTINTKLLNGNTIRTPTLTLVLHKDFLQGNKKEFQFSVVNNDAAFREFGKKVKIRSIGTVNFELSVKDRDPRLVAKIVNTIREEFLEVYYSTTEVQDVSVLAQLEKNLEIARERLDKSQNKLSAFYRKHPSLLYMDEAPDASKSLNYLNLKSEESELRRTIDELQKLMAAKPVTGRTEETFYWANEILSAMGRAGEPQANIIKGKLLNLNQKKLQLESTLGPGHPQRQEVQSELENSYTEIDNVYAKLIRKLNSQKSRLSRQVLSSRPRRIQPSVKSQLELQHLMKANKNHQDAYDKLLGTFNRAKLTTGSEFFKVNVVDKARPAQYRPPSLKERLLVAVAAMGILFFIIPTLFVLYIILLVRIWTMDDVKQFLGMKTLGFVIKHKWEPIKKQLKKSLKMQPHPLTLFHGSHHTLKDIECFRSLREEVLNFFKKGDRSNMSLLVTSTRPGEGKSTCSTNLALAFARLGKQTLLIDGEMRRGLCHQLLGTVEVPGLSELLRAEAGITDEDIQRVIQPTIEGRCFLLPKGEKHSSAGEIIGTSRFKRILDYAKEHYDIVIIDSPPLLIAADALPAMDYVNGVLFICRSGQTLVSEAKEALELIQERDVKAGAIVNAVSITPVRYSKYNKYSYYYLE